MRADVYRCSVLPESFLFLLVMICGSCLVLLSSFGYNLKLSLDFTVKQDAFQDLYVSSLYVCICFYVFMFSFIIFVFVRVVRVFDVTYSNLTVYSFACLFPSAVMLLSVQLSLIYGYSWR